MKGIFRGAASCALVAAIVCAGVPSTSQAQVMPGTYLLRQVVTSMDGSTTVGKVLVLGTEDVSRSASPVAGVTVGLLRVPPRPGGTEPYEEDWLLFPEYTDVLEEGTALVIEPLPMSPERAEALFAATSAKVEVTHRRILAERRDLETEGADQREPMDECEIESDASEGDFRTVWQRRRGEPGESVLVGFVRASNATVEGDEQWCLTGEYVYPAPDNGVIMELRPASTGDLKKVAVQLHASHHGHSVPHRIRVSPQNVPGAAGADESRDVTDPGPTLWGGRGCAIGGFDPVASYCVVLGFAGIVLAGRRMRHHKGRAC